MPGEDDIMDFGDSGAAVSTKSAMPHDEMVWAALHPGLDTLKGDLASLVSNQNVKNQMKAKFAATEKCLKTILTEKIVEVISLTSAPSVPESRAVCFRPKVSDLIANLAGEWSDTLEALYQVFISKPVHESVAAEVAAKRDLYMKKVVAAMKAFEQQFVERLKPPGTFDQLDFASTRPSMEADFPFEDDAIGKARVNHLEDQLTQAEKHIKHLEGDADSLSKMVKSSDHKIAELQKQLAPLSYVGKILGCEDNQIQQSVNNLDHSACQQQLADLQAQLQHEQLNTASSASTIKELRDVVASMRDQLAKHGTGIGRSVEDRLQQLGLINGSKADVGSSAASFLDNSQTISPALEFL